MALHVCEMTQPTSDGWYTIWSWDVYEQGGKYYTTAYYFAELKQWSKCGQLNKCIIEPYGWMI